MPNRPGSLPLEGCEQVVELKHSREQARKKEPVVWPVDLTNGLLEMVGVVLMQTVVMQTAEMQTAEMQMAEMQMVVVQMVVIQMVVMQTADQVLPRRLMAVAADW